MCSKKAFNIITNKNVIVNANSIVQHVIQIKNGILKHVNVSVKNIVRILAHIFVRMTSI